MPHDYTASDEALIQSTGKGDLNAFEEIVRRHQSWVWRIAYRYIGQQEEAADLVQEAFIRLMAASRRYQPTASFRTYFNRIVTRLCLDHSRKKRPITIGTLPDVSDPSPNATDILTENERNRSVRKAIDALPANQRMAVILRYDEELSYQEIAVALDVTPKAVERLLSRARSQLRDHLGVSEHFSRP